MAVPTEKNTINQIKSWAFPILVAVLGWMIKTDISEMKSDVKALLAQSNVDKTKIEHLEHDVDVLNKAVFKVSKNAPSSSREKDNVVFSQLVYAKPEDVYDIKKHLNIQN